MKLDKDTYLLSQDLYIRFVTAPNYEGNDSQTAVNCIRQANAFFDQWEAMQLQLSAAAAQAMEEAKPVVQPLPRKGDNERQKLEKAPVKPLRAKASAKHSKRSAKPLKAKRKG